MKFSIKILTIFVLSLVALSMTPQSVIADEKLWQALKTPNHFAMIRHARAPGTGDPENFAINDCTTQRNLSDDGRDQARRIGEKFRKNGITAASVYSSQWCRCRETAVLLGIGKPIDLPSLNSFYEMRENEKPQMKALRQWIAEHPMTSPLVLVSHFVNTGALTDTFPNSGGMVVVKREANGNLTVLGEIDTK